MITALCDDINTPAFFGHLFEHLSVLTVDEKAIIKSLLVDVLGLPLLPLQMPQVIMTPHIQQLLDLREQARQAKDWTRADELRDQLTELGYTMHDKKIT
jgi:cysteinyl-tRNA synthetase